MTGQLATPRLAAGALFVKDAHLLLVHKTYGNGWDIPGGRVDYGESPAAACRRELREELGLDRPPLRLLVHDWAPDDGEGDKILYVFSCGALGDDEERIRVDGVELDRWAWVALHLVDRYVIPRLARRLTCAYTAYRDETVLYLEHGAPVLRPVPGVGSPPACGLRGNPSPP
ncbi:MAG TPA: NUDIX hydrolase [Pseudonocardia sp.]|nr:NUDIX hydrolase [Pseudonocardia sp.]